MKIIKIKKTKNTTLSEQSKNSIAKNVESGTIDTLHTQIHDCTLSWLGTGTSIKSGGVKPFLA